MSTNSKELAVVKQKMESLKPHLQAVATKYLTPERLAKLVTTAMGRNPLLLKAWQDSPHSVLRCVMASAQLGLEPDSPLGLCYFVPRKNSKSGGAYEATFVVGYRGLIDLARRSGNIKSIESRVVYERDYFEEEYGLQPKLIHRPGRDEDRGPMVACYAIAHFGDGGAQYEVMSKSEIDAVRNRSPAGKYGPWASDYTEMARKTVVRRLSKYLPLTPDLHRAAEHEDATEDGTVSSIDVELQEIPELAENSEQAQAEPQDQGTEILGKIKG